MSSQAAKTLISARSAPAALLRCAHHPTAAGRAVQAVARRSFQSSAPQLASHSAPTTAQGWANVISGPAPLWVGTAGVAGLTAGGLALALFGQREQVADRTKHVSWYIKVNPLITGDPHTPHHLAERAASYALQGPQAAAAASSTPSPLHLEPRPLQSSSSDSEDDDSSLSSLVSSAVDALSDTLGLTDSESEASKNDTQGAFNPETGEINWDCPCLGGMAHGPCGEEFKAAFSCFVFSEQEPKGMDCITHFEGMQNCFKKHPEIYAEELAGDEEAEAEAKKREAEAEEKKQV